MSSLDKLQILGIRSFGPRTFEAIKFLNPVTLIIGENGSGKTTLIECLRYATTGEVPSFTAGAAGRNANFAHDLNVSDIDSCKSQVKLIFRDVSDETIVAIRSMQSSRKTVSGQRKIDCKTLDSSIKRKDRRTGQPMEITTKCNDMNREMSNLLGVADAVLTNVIFCHQEDSNWPLSEPKALKCRFDDIFSATKYMKVLDAIKNNQKELKKVISECKKEIVHLNTFKDLAKTCRQQIESAEAELRQYADDTARLNGEIEPIQARLEEVGRHRGQIETLRSKLAGLKSEKATTEKNINELRANIHDYYAGEVEDLKQEIDQFESDQKRMLTELTARKREAEQLVKKESVLDKQKGELLTKKGKLESDIHNNTEQIEKRDKQIVEFAAKYQFPGFGRTPISEAKVAEFQEQMQKKASRTNEDIKSEKSDIDKRCRDAKLESEKASNAVAANEQAIALKETTVTRTEREIKETKAFLSDMDSRQARLEKLGQEIGNLEKQLDSAAAQVNEEVLKADIAKMQTERNKADSKIRSLQEELKVANRENSLRLTVDMLEKEKAAKDDNLQKLLDKHRDALKEFFPGVDVNRLRDAVDDNLISRNKELQASNKKLSDATLAQKSKEKERDMRTADLKAKEQELRDKEDKIVKVCDGDDIDDELEKVRQSLDKLQFEKGTTDGSETVYKSYIRKLESRPCCPLCDRNFDDKKDATVLSEKLKREIKSLPERASGLRQKIEEHQKRQTDLLQLQPVVQSVKNLKMDISALRKQLEDLTTEIKALKKEIAELDNIVTIHMDEEQTVKAVQADVGQIDSLNREIQIIERRVTENKEKLGSGQNIRSVETIDEEISVVQMDLDDFATNLQAKQDALSNYRDKVQRLRQRINDLTKEKLEITDAMQQRIAYQEKYSSLTAQRDQCRQDLDELRRKTQSLKAALDDLRNKERKLEAERDEWNRESQKRRQDLDNSSRIISEMNDSIRKFRSSGKTEQFDECVQKVESIEADLADVGRRCAALTKENEEQERALNQSKIRLRDLEDSLKVKEKEKHIRELAAEITKCTDDFERLGGMNVAGGDYEAIMRKHKDLVQQLHKIEGQKKALERSLAEKREQLESTGYKDADKNYSDKLIQLVTTETALNDLAKYYNALDKAVIKYHSSKMEEINEKLRELWQKIYKHNDIDYVAIKSESESSDKRRAYNYRVVMHCGGTELDMRGRCSAGQKVLASILIRIALAEVFSSSCGVLALDEPTTNLDEANIRGLAEALLEIIKEKQQQKNFQLILITHDENFVRLLLGGDEMDRDGTHYRISKNESGHSTITVCKNSELSD